jgi:signal transduction histidine kinase/CheY-like chemotaxis protein
MPLRLFADKAQDVLDNYPLRVVILWLALAIHLTVMWGSEILPKWFWIIIFFHTLILPHVFFLASSHRKHECRNLLIDVAIFGVYIGTWGFNPFLAALFIATSNLTLLSLGGWKLMFLALNAQIMGALLGGWITNFYFREYLTLIPTLIATVGFFGFMIAIGWLVHKINRRLHVTRRHIKEQHNELTHLNELALAVNSHLTIDSIIRRLLYALEPAFPFEVVYFLSLEVKLNKLIMAGIYGEGISSQERAHFERLEFDMVKDSDSIFVLGLVQRRVINIGYLHPNLVNEGAQIDRKLYEIKPSVSIVYFPLYVEDSVLGGLAFVNHKYHFQLEKRDIQRITRYLVQVGTAIKNANLIRQLQCAKEEALIAQKKAEESEEAKSRFLANMSHEIRTPMTAILGYSEILQEASITTDERLKCVDIIMKSGRHLLAMINNILDISKIEASKVHLERICIDVVHIMTEIQSYLELQAGEKGLIYSVEVDFPVPQFVVNDPTRLRQVLLNLCNNAIKFTSCGSVKLVLSWPQESLLKFSVTDTGIGMTNEECAVAFEAFMQADTSTTRLYGGTGLGLAISKNLAKLMGGDLKVESEKGRGSTFILEIDIGTHEGVVIESQREWRRLQKKQFLAMEKQSAPSFMGRVLVAEDNPVNQQIIKRLLEQAGLYVDLVCDGQQAYEKVLKDFYDLALLDMQMPVMGGQRAAEAIKIAGIQTPLIAFTANVMTHQIDDYFKSGFVGVVEKPIIKEKLYFLLESHLKRSAATLRKVLIVDDDDINTMIIARQIKSYSDQLTVLQAINGQEALAKVDSYDVDIIFMDMEMPIMGGVEATQKLRAKGFIKPIFIVTGNIDQEHKALCLAAGATGHLAKPLHKNKIRSILERY